MILGVWTKEEFKDALIIASATALVAFFTSMTMQWLSKYVKSR